MKTLPTPRDIEVMAATAGLRMYEVCHRANVAPNTFSRWKHGKLSPNIATVQALLDALNPCEEDIAQ